MKKPIFATDLDGCLLDSGKAFADWYTRELGVKIVREDLTNWKHEQCLGIPSKLVTKMFTEIWNSNPMAILPGAMAFLDEVKQLGYSVVVITSRGMPNGKEDAGKAAFRDTRLFYEHGLIDDMIVMDNSKQPKFDFLNRLGALWMLEDNTNVAIQCKIHGKTLKEMFLIDRPWNKSKDIVGYKRVLSYGGVLSHLYSHQ